MKPVAGEVRDLVGRQLGLRSVRLEDHLVEDLDAVSADIVNIVAALEDLFEIVIEEEALADIRRVDDLCRMVTARIDVRQDEAAK
jgi:acyl carrier protein